MGISFIERVAFVEEPLPQTVWISEPLHAGEYMMALGFAVLVLAYFTVKRDQSANNPVGDSLFVEHEAELGSSIQ